MSNRTYPRIGSKRKQPAIKRKRRCKQCKQLTPMRKPIWRVDVQFNQFRGDDGVWYVCLNCMVTQKKAVERTLLNPVPKE